MTENEMMKKIEEAASQYDITVEEHKEMYSDEIKELAATIRAADDWTDVMDECKELCTIANAEDLWDCDDEGFDFELFMRCVGKTLGEDVF